MKPITIEDDPSDDGLYLFILSADDQRIEGLSPSDLRKIRDLINETLDQVAEETKYDVTINLFDDSDSPN